VICKPLDLGLAALAAVNLAVGVAVSFNAANLADLRTVARWSREWIDGVSPYGPSALTDYPPWAIVELAPIALVPMSWLPAIWVAVNLALAFVIARSLASQSGEAFDIRRRLLLLIVAAACLRTLTQFSLLSYALALTAVFTPDWRTGGAIAGLALFKPQIGGVVLLADLVRGEWRRVLLAVGVVASLAAIFVWRIGVDAGKLAARYLDILRSIHASPATLPGHSDLRVWLWALWPDTTANAWLTVTLWAALLAPLLWIARRDRPWTRDDRLELLALCGTLSLLAIRHLSYDFVVLLPAMVAWRCPPFAERAHGPRWAFALLAVLLVGAIPSWIRLLIGHGAPSWISVLTEIDRVMCLSMWAVLSWRLTTGARASTTTAP
jgi:hypothetical protein